MDSTSIQTRLLQSLLRAVPTASVSLQNHSRMQIGDLAIELLADRIVIGPRTTSMTPEQVHVLMDPDSILWFVARYDDADFAGRVSRFLKRRGVEVPADWLTRGQRPAPPPSS